MGSKLLWTGATLLLAVPHLSLAFTVLSVGAWLMVVGCIATWFGK